MRTKARINRYNQAIGRYTTPLATARSLGNKKAEQAFFKKIQGVIAQELKSWATISSPSEAAVAFKKRLLGEQQNNVYAISLLESQPATLTTSSLSRSTTTTTTSSTSPIGISNSGTDCFANAALQVLFNNTSLELKQKLVRIPVLKDFLNTVRTAQLLGKNLSISSKAYRAWISRIVPKKGQQDGSEALECTLNAANYRLPLEIAIRTNSGVVIQNEQLSKDDYARPFISLDPKIKTMESAIANFFYKNSLRLEKAPSDLFFEVTRNQTGSRKIHGSFPFEEQFALDNRFNRSRDNSQYELSSAMIHTGTINSGHYYALIKKDGQWHLANDKSSKPITVKQAMNLLKFAYVVHYRKVESAPLKRQIGDPSPAPKKIIALNPAPNSQIVEPISQENSSRLRKYASMTSAVVGWTFRTGWWLITTAYTGLSNRLYKYEQDPKKTD